MEGLNRRLDTAEEGNTNTRCQRDKDMENMKEILKRHEGQSEKVSQKV